MIQKLNMVTDALSRVGSGEDVSTIAREHSVSPVSLTAWITAYKASGQAGLEAGKSSGRKPLCDWPADDVQAIREVAIRTNRGDELISLSHAVRRCVHEGKVSEATAAALKRPAASKHYIPKSLKDQLAISPSVVRHHRNPRNARLSGVYVPGTTRMAADGTRRLYAGERMSYDDGSQNQVVVVPWPYGGSKEADKFGHRTCRGQWLVAHDDATGMITGWVFTLRPRDSYRDQDSLGLMYRVARDVCRPDEAVVEGGTWQSIRAKAFLDASGITARDAKGRPHLKLIENWFGRAWTYLSVFEDGQIGRFRGEYERENKLLVRAHAGAIDGREYFPLLPQLLKELEDCVTFLNQDPIESKEYGKWTPIERWNEDMAQRPRATLSDELAPYAAPESHVVKVRRGGMVVCDTMCPLGIPSTYSFAHEDLAAFEGHKVRVMYDPFEAEVRAAIVHLKTRKPVCIATCLNPPPAPVADLDWEIFRSDSATYEAIRLKKAMANAVRTEYRALGNGRRGAQVSELRGPDGVRRIELATSTGSEAASGRVETTELTSSVSSARGSLSPAVDPLQRGALSSADAGRASGRGGGVKPCVARRGEVDADKLAAEADALEAKLRARGDLVQM
ncbi:MAG TPA: hypothetical protein PKC67_02460 [Kiritimatiellia bacterium]|nr:hypothetical protein [Kiritimatiellia bacterium]HMP33188.1 hypothetical protein [Kiritimatiellia bacterium]